MEPAAACHPMPPMPNGYGARAEWAWRYLLTNRQVPCPTCNYLDWVPAERSTTEKIGVWMLGRITLGLSGDNHNRPGLLSYTEIAEGIGCSVSTVSRAIRGNPWFRVYEPDKRWATARKVWGLSEDGRNIIEDRV